MADQFAAITREQSVRAYTQGSAFAEFAEGEKGTIATGKLADLAVLSQDIFTVAAHDLPKTSSVLTMVGGKIVYEAPAADGKSNAQHRRVATPALIATSDRRSLHPAHLRLELCHQR